MEASLVRASEPWWRRAVPIPWPALAAAGAIVLMALTFSNRDRPELPPTPTRTISFEEGVEWHAQS
jgi:hypothetical protein